MLQFSIKPGRGKRPPTVQFEDQHYALASELLLAERSILPQLCELLTNAAEEDFSDESLSGNAFTVKVSRRKTVITNDVTDKTLEIPTADLRAAAEAYAQALKK